MSVTYLTPVEAEVAVGDFFVCNWGYDQTNIDFYKVVGVTAKGVKIQRWTSRGGGGNEGPQVAVVPGDRPATVTDWSSGEPVEVDAPIRQKRLSRFTEHSPYIHINSFSGATKWDGKAEYRTGQVGATDMSKPFGGHADNPLREMFPLGMAVLDEIPTDDTGHVTDCGYEDPDGDCACSDLLSRIEAAVREASPDTRIVEQLRTLPWGLDEDIDGADLVQAVYELLASNGRLPDYGPEPAEEPEVPHWRDVPGNLCQTIGGGLVRHVAPCAQHGTVTRADTGEVVDL